MSNFKTSNLHKAWLWATTAVLVPTFMAAAPAVRAEDTSAQIETVIVTATKRPENVQDIPQSVTAISGKTLERANITNVQDLAQFVPGLQVINANNARNSNVVIRGVGTFGSNPGFEADVGIFVDGVFIPASGAILNELQDISSVTVLRGPQGTLYGGNSPVGAIVITSRAPTAATEGMIDVDIGNFDERRVSGYFGGAITSNINGRISLWSDDHSGYEHNVFTNSSINDGRQYGSRLRLQWKPSDLTTVDLMGYYNKNTTDGTAAAQINPFGIGGIGTPGFLAAAAAAVPGHPFVALKHFEVNAGDNSGDETESWGTAATVTRKLPFNATLTNILSYNSFDDKLSNQALTNLPQSIEQNPQDDLVKTTSDELRIASRTDQRVNYVAGVFLVRETTDFYFKALYGAGANRPVSAALGTLTPGDTSVSLFNQTKTSEAAFAQATFKITDKFRAIGGARYSNSEKTASTSVADTNAITGVPSAALKAANPIFSQTGLKRDDSRATWTAGLQYDIASSVMGYFTASTGFKEGGFNGRAAAVQIPFQPETSLTYELGLKSQWFNRRLLVNADIYQMNVDQFQQSTLNPATGTGFIVGNAGDIRVKGVELEVQAQASAYLSFHGNVGYADTVYSSYPKGTCISSYPVAGSTPPAGSPRHDAISGNVACDYNGFTPPFAPKVRANAGARWEAPLGTSQFNLIATGDASFTDKQYLDASLDPRSLQKAYTLLSASLGIAPREGHWRLSLYAKNLLNTQYYQIAGAQAGGSLINAGPNAAGTGINAANGFVGYYGTPRTFGLTASYTF